MTEHGLKQVEAAKADGRWDKAYGSGKDMKIPPDLQAAIDDPDSDWVYVRFVPTPDETARAHRGKKQVFIAGKTVSGLESKNWQSVSQAGVDGILTDFALPLAAQLRRKQAAGK